MWNLAIAAGVVIALVILAVVLSPALWLIIPILPTVAITAALRRGPVTSGMIAGVLGFAMVVVYAAILYAIRGPEDRASDPDCDGFCYTRTEGWMLLLFIASVLGAIVAVASAVLAALMCARNGRVDSSP